MSIKMEVPMCIQKKSKSKYTVDDCVFLCMRNAYNNKRWLMFHEIQRIISEQTGKFFGEATISASIRNMRKDYCRKQKVKNVSLHSKIIPLCSECKYSKDKN